jgi:hypothetical protein
VRLESGNIQDIGWREEGFCTSAAGSLGGGHRHERFTDLEQANYPEPALVSGAVDRARDSSSLPHPDHAKSPDEPQQPT